MTLEKYINENIDLAINNEKNNFYYSSDDIYYKESFYNLVFDYISLYKLALNDIYYIQSKNYDVYDFLDEDIDGDLIYCLISDLEKNKLNNFLKLDNKELSLLVNKILDSTFKYISKYNVFDFINLNFVNELFGYEFKNNTDTFHQDSYKSFKEIFNYNLLDQLHEYNLLTTNDNYNKIVYDIIYNKLSHIRIKNYINIIK